jgi:hypothetical protein
MCVVQARSPLNLSHLGLTSAALPNLSPFKFVTVLNLSHNKLTTLDGSGIGGMASLMRLDLQHNLLEYVSPESGWARRLPVRAENARDLYLCVFPMCPPKHPGQPSLTLQP